jgi:3-isopropylmalate/(R)-2-methylmalate dehydratase large subunit
LEPQIACPDRPDNVFPIRRWLAAAGVSDVRNGRLEDLIAAAEILRGHTVSVRLVVIPASAQVYLDALRAGAIETLLQAGAAVGTPGCGPCMGNHMGIPAPNEATISSANRNFRGRMGTPDAPIYLASPYVVAAT